MTSVTQIMELTEPMAGDDDVVAAVQAGLSAEASEGLLVHVAGPLAKDLAALRRVLRVLRTDAFRGRVRVAQLTLDADVTATELGEVLRVLLRHGLATEPVRLQVLPGGPDALVAQVIDVAQGPVTAARVTAVRDAWLTLHPPVSAREPVRLLRLLDDALRVNIVVATHDALGRERRQIQGTVAWERACEALGPEADWLAVWQRSLQSLTPEVAIIPTWQCELRCVYCTIPKQDGRVMTPEVAEQAVDLLLSSGADDVLLHLFGGEPLLNFPLVQHALRYGMARATELGRRITFKITTNAHSATNDKLDWLADYPVRFQLSLDGDAATQHAVRPTLDPEGDSFARSAAHRARDFLDRGFDVEVIMVVHTSTVDRMVDNFWLLAGMGYPRIQVNYAYGSVWRDEARRTFAAELFRLGDELWQAWREGRTQVQLVNLAETVQGVRVNGRLTVDWNGRVYGSNSFLYSPALEKGQRLGMLDDGYVGYDRFVLDGFDEEHLLTWTYRDKMRANNLAVGEVMTSFVRWMHDQGDLESAWTSKHSS